MDARSTKHKFLRLRTAIPSKNWPRFSRRQGWSLKQRHLSPTSSGKI